MSRRREGAPLCNPCLLIYRISPDEFKMDTPETQMIPFNRK